MSRFGGADRDDEGSGAGGEDESEVEDSIDQGPWGLAAYAYYWWSGATGQVKIFQNLPRYHLFHSDRSLLKILVRLHGCLEQLLIEQLAECQCCKEDLSCL